MKRTLCMAVLLGAAASVPLAAQGKSQPKAKAPSAPVTGAFIIRLGNDTVAIEQFTRNNQKLSGDIVFRSPTTRIVHYEATLAPDGSISRMESATRPGNAAPDSPPLTSNVMTWTGDTALVELRRGDSTRSIRVATQPGTVPFLPNSYALYEIGLRRAFRPNADSVAVAMLPFGAQSPSMVGARRVGRDSVYIYTLNGLMQTRLEANGDLRGGRVVTGTQQVTVERAKLQDFPALVAGFVVRDQQGARMGQLSPPDSVITKVGTANVAIKYSKPSRRGRTVFGSGIVPWGQVWRTGANAATSFTTDADVMIGGTLVPAGNYTLFTVPDRDKWKLIINKQTGQWGTVYDEKQDLARVDMQVTTLSTPVEQFVIAIDPAPQGAVLRMAWEDRQATVPITAR